MDMKKTCWFAFSYPCRWVEEKSEVVNLEKIKYDLHIHQAIFLLHRILALHQSFSQKKKIELKRLIMRSETHFHEDSQGLNYTIIGKCQFFQ
jgi:hypothetical protein